MDIGALIKEKRVLMNITQEHLGRTLHVTRQTVSRWENNKTLPNFDTLIELSKIFNISLDTLLKEKENDMTNNIKKEGRKYKFYRKYFIITLIGTTILTMFLITLGYGRAQQISNIDRINPFIKTKIGYANLPPYKNNTINTYVMDDVFGNGEWLTLITGKYDKDALLIVKHKGSYVSKTIITNRNSIPSTYKKQLSGTYEAYNKKIYGPKNGKNIPWLPFD